MKTIYRLLSAAFAGLMVLASCEKLLDQDSPSAFDDKTVFSNYALAEQTIFSIHMTFGEQNGYRGRLLPWYGFNTDIEWYNSPKAGDLDKTAIAAYDVRPNNNQLNAIKNPFSDMYSGIERANLTIDGIRRFNDVTNDPKMAYLLAEALTLRAMIYYDLVKCWGDVPARFEPLTTETMYVKRSNRDVIFKQILKDLEEAIPYLPYPGTEPVVAKTDRVNKVFAEGLYARIALAAAGYAIRPDDGKEGTGDLGSVRLSSDKDLQKSVLYPKALEYLKDAITSETCSLIPDYEQLWRSFNELDITAGKEFLFNIPFGSTDTKARGRWNYSFAVKTENTGFFGRKAFSQGGTAGPTPTFWFRYDPRDTRRDITCVNFKWDKGVPVPAGINNWYFGKFRFEWMSTYPYSGGNDDGIKPVVMRYADILLMAAEMANELNDPTFAKKCLKEVRTRAFKGNEQAAESYVDALSGKDAIFEAIANERALEFCGEFLRKADLIRWNRLYSAIEAEKTEMKNLAACTGKYDGLGSIWYRLGEDGETIDFYGLGPGETGKPDGEWEKEDDYISTSKLKDSVIDLIHMQTDEASFNRRQFWPLFQYVIDNSQNTLVNDYKY